MEWLDRVYWGNTVSAWLIAGGIACGIVIIAKLVQLVLKGRLRKIAEKTSVSFDDVLVDIIEATKGPIVAVLAISAGAMFVVLPFRVQGIAVAALLAQFGIWASAAIRSSVSRYRTRKEEEEDLSGLATVQLASLVGRMVVWAMVLLILLDTFGVDVTALVTGLGIGGVAVALAVQNILADLFASVSIVLDKPFAVGDFIVVGDFMGSVEKIGIKTTRLRSLSGEQLVFSNADLLSSRIRNYKRMNERRIAFTVGVTYQTPPAKIERIPEMLRAAVEARNDTRFDRAHFQKFGDSALIFEVVYYMTDPDYLVFMNEQQAINLDIMRAFAGESIEMAYPTQTLFVQKSAA